MKVRLIKWVSLTIPIIMVSCVIVLFYNPSIFIEIVKFAVHKSFKTVDINIGSVVPYKKDAKTFYHIDSVKFYKNNKTLFVLENIKLSIDFSHLISHLKFDSTIIVKSATVGEEKINFLNQNFKIQYSNNIKSYNQSFDITMEHYHNRYYQSEFKCHIARDFFITQVNQCELKLGDQSKISIDGKIKGNKLSLNTSMYNIHTDLYKQFEGFFINSDILDLLKKTDLSANIIEGQTNIKINLDKFQKNERITAREISGRYDFHDLYLKYDRDFPPLKNVSGKLDIDGDNIFIKTTDGLITSSRITNSDIRISWNNNIDKNSIFIKGKIVGPAKDLADFINKDKLVSLKKWYIDLEKIEGDAITNLDIIIPFAKDHPNSYIADASISHTNLDLMKYLQIRNGDLNLKLNNNNLTLEGIMIMNKCPTEIKGIFQITNAESVIDVSTSLCKNFDLNETIKINDSKAILNFHWTDKPHKNKLYLHSDLQNADFTIRYPTIHKKDSIPLKLSIKGEFNNYQKLKDIIVSFDGDETKIKGKIILDKDGVIYDFPKVESKENDVSIKYSNSDKVNNLIIKGNKLDLSQSNFYKFVDIGPTSRNKDILSDVQVNEIKMHNDITYKNLISNVDYVNQTFKTININADINNQDSFIIQFSNVDENKKFFIKTDNFGDLLKSLDFNSINNGILVLNILQNKDTKEMEGDFLLKKFVVKKPFALIHIASMTSIPSLLMKLVQHDHSVPFDVFQGKIQLHNDSWEIYFTRGEGTFFDFTMNGNINFNDRSISLTGLVLPSIAGTENFLKIIPIIRDISWGMRAGLASFTTRYSTNFNF